ncbi:hypothetical protein PFISCL1PPCAC_21769, partial [Pristionchus fissidentatus]
FSAGGEIMLARVFIFEGAQQKKKVIVEVPSSTRVCDLHLHPDLCEYIQNDKNEWSCEGDALKRVTIGNVSRITHKRPIELVCRLKKDEGEEEKKKKEEEMESIGEKEEEKSDDEDYEETE